MPGALDRSARMGEEEGETHADDTPETHADFGREPAHLADHDCAMQGKANEVTDEQQLPSQKAPRAETPQVGTERENQRNDDQGDNSVIADSDPESQGRNEWDGEDQERDHLTLGRGILHARAG